MPDRAKRNTIGHRITILIFLAACFLCCPPIPLHAGVTNETRPEIYCEFSSSKGPIDRGRVRMWLNGRDVTAEAVVETWKISYRPAQPLEPGEYRVRVEVYDILGSRGQKMWAFTVDPAAEDTAAPTIELIPPTPKNGGSLAPGGEVEIAARVDDAGGVAAGSFQFEFSKDGRQVLVPSDAVAFEDGLFKASLGALEPGRYSVSLSVADLAENRSEPAASAFSVEPGAARSRDDPAVSLMESLEQPRARRKGTFYLDDLPGVVTGEPEIDVTGRAPAGVAVELLLNGIPVRRDFAEPSGDFGFPNVRLSENENYVAAAITSDDGFTEIETDEQMVFVDTREPVIDEPATSGEEVEIIIRVPRDEQTLKYSPINVQGKAPAGAGVGLLVNSSEVAQTTANPGGVFHFKKVQLAQGQNTLQAVAIVGGAEYESEQITVTLQEK